MKVIGITGGVGAGKSLVLDILEREYGALVMQADIIAKELMEPDTEGYRALVPVLGAEILTEDGHIDRAVLADRMYHDKTVIETVNSIIHPLVWQEIRRRISVTENSLVVVEAALTDENSRDIYDELWYLYTSEETRIKRLSQSRGYSREKTVSMMANQPSETEFRTRADHVIDNNGSSEETRQQIHAILNSEGRS